MLKRGEEIINDVPVVEGSSTGVYGYLILLFVTFAKGDVHKTRITFNDLAKSFSNGFKKTLLFSFEQDLVSLILCSFPMIFEQENKRQLMRRKEMEELLMVLKKKVLNRKNQKRSTFFLLKAKIFDQLQTKDARRYYKQALKLSNAMNHDLITCLSCLWYGQNLEDLGTLRPHYLKESWEISRRNKFFILQKYIEGVLSHETGQNKLSVQLPRLTGSDLPFQNFPTSLSYTHLAFISKPFVRGITYKHSIEKSLRELIKSYKAQKTRLLLQNPDGSTNIFCVPEDTVLHVTEEDLTKHLKPFLNLNETMIVPQVVCPWLQNQQADESVSTDSEDQTISLSSTISEEQEVADSSQPDAADHHKTQNIQDSSSESQPFNKKTIYRGKEMNAYIPVSSSSGNQGVLLLEKPDAKFCGPSVLNTRKELDMFGSQLGLVVERDFYSREMQHFSDLWTSNYFDPISWLKIWSKGSLPDQSKSSWSLGLSLPDHQYLLFFCELSGGEEKERQLISSMLWHHMLVLQILAKSNHKSESTSNIRDHFASILTKTPEVQTLGNIAISFSLFSRNADLVLSGHFGESRPLVLGGTNLVRPFNDVIMTFDHGRDLRYWEVRGTWDELSPLFVCSNTHCFDIKLKIRDADILREQIRTQQPEPGLHHFLESVFPASQLPLYYVAVTAQQSPHSQGPGESQEAVR